MSGTKLSACVARQFMCLVFNVIQLLDPLQHLMRLSCLLGDETAVRTRAKRLIERPDGEYFDVLGVEDALGCLAGEFDPSDLIAKAGDSRVKQCTAYFTQAMLHLCAGEQDAAIRSLESSRDTLGFTFFEHELAKVFLKKLKSDPGWLQGLQD